MKLSKLFGLLFVLLFLAVCADLFPQEKIQILPDTDLDTYIERAMERWKIPGVSVAIVKKGKIVLAKGYGVRELGKSDKVDENTIFAIASNSKAFTGTAIAMLEAENKLSLDEKVTKYIPYFKLQDVNASALVTVKDLLTHRIGMGTFQGDFLTWGTNFSRSELIKKIGDANLQYGFRSGYGYFNSGFLTAGEIIPVVTGKSWDNFIIEKFFIPLSMNRSFTSIDGLKNIENIATPHTYNYDYVMTPIPWRNVDNLAPAASICSSVSDMAQWILMQTNLGTYDGKTIVNKKVILKTLTPFNVIPSPAFRMENLTGKHFTTYGLGWFLQDYRGKLLVEHSGGYDGMVSRTAFLLEEETGLVILTNNDQNELITSLMFQIFDYYLNAPPVNWDSLIYERVMPGFAQEKSGWDEIMQTKSSLPNSYDINSLKGIYTNSSAGDAEIKSENGKLFVELKCRPGMKGYLENWKNDTLICSTNDYVFGRCLLPVKSENGKVISIKIKASDFVDPEYYEFVKKD